MQYRSIIYDIINSHHIALTCASTFDTTFSHIQLDMHTCNFSMFNELSGCVHGYANVDAKRDNAHTKRPSLLVPRLDEGR